MLLAAAERDVAALLFEGLDLDNHAGWQSRYAASSVAHGLCRRSWELGRDGLFDFLLYLASRPAYEVLIDPVQLIGLAEACGSDSPLVEGERYTLHLLRSAMVHGPLLGMPPPHVARLTALIGDGAGFYLAPDEHWSIMLNKDIHALPDDERVKWIALLKHWLTATAARPSDKWLRSCAKLVNEIGAETVAKRLLTWLSHVPSGRASKILPGYVGDTRGSGDIIQQENANCLRGMFWTLPAFERNRDEIARVVATVAQSAYRKIPGVGRAR